MRVVALFAMCAVRPALGQVVASPHGELPEGLDCGACHTASGWTPLRSPLAFEHGERSGFLITGAHGQTPCAGCHTDLRFNGPDVPMNDCAGCHADPHEGRQVQECAACHTTTSFRDVDGEAIHARTSFPLTGAHLQVTCESCHLGDQGGAFTSLDPTCASCHVGAYEGARTVDHVAAGYPTDCVQCHSTLGWADTPSFDHAAASGGFGLLGAHQDLRCVSCHMVPGMEPLFPVTDAQDCAGCHQDDYEREHGGSRFPTTCAVCHGVDDWDVGSFDHALTGFALVGRHANMDCGECHQGEGGALRFPVPAQQDDCVACHRKDYDDEHGGSGFPTTCLSCHTVDDWEDGSFNHAATAFPLVGAHEAAPCADCHGPPAHLAEGFKGPEECLACHQADYDREHAGSGFETTCLSCHARDTWSGATFDHTAQTGFALQGPHTPLTCTACHAVPGHTLLFPKPGTADDCVACHQGDYDAEHAGSGFETTCLSCHARDTWSGATLDHTSVSGGFELVGAHVVTPCASCHSAPGYALLFPPPSGPNDCLVCHQTDYQTAHGPSGYPTDCVACHTATAWEPSTFDHDAQFFPIYSGEHLGEWNTCADCHPSPGNLAEFSCIVCHEHDQVEMDDEHKGENGYVYASAACLSCHPTGKAD
jgi:hypothetical protein